MFAYNIMWYPDYILPSNVLLNSQAPWAGIQFWNPY